MTLAPESGGGLVLEVGIRGWACLLNRSCVTDAEYSWPAMVDRDSDIVVGAVRNDPAMVRIVQNVTMTILKAVSAGPAGNLVSSSGYSLAGG